MNRNWRPHHFLGSNQPLYKLGGVYVVEFMPAIQSGQLFAGFAAGPLAAWAYPFLRETAAELINGDQHLGTKMWNIFTLHANHTCIVNVYYKCEIYNGCYELIMGSCLCVFFTLWWPIGEIDLTDVFVDLLVG